MSDLQRKVDEICWYHEFDFGNGVRATSRTPDVASHRKGWRFIEEQLGRIDFRDKTVLEIGAWDGYWSFFAERQGAKSVLATDDISQNWSDGRGLPLAKELLHSSISVNQELSIYKLASLNQTFDVIMCLGVYYHLLDPFYAFAQIRHCCHPGTVVLLEGNVAQGGIRESEAQYTFANPALSVFIPSIAVLENLLESAYLRVQSHQLVGRSSFARLKGLVQQIRHFNNISTVFVNRAFTVCTPFEGANALHPYEPPFELRNFDDRFRGPGSKRP